MLFTLGSNAFFSFFSCGEGRRPALAVAAHTWSAPAAAGLRSFDTRLAALLRTAAPPSRPPPPPVSAPQTQSSVLEVLLPAPVLQHLRVHLVRRHLRTKNQVFRRGKLSLAAAGVARLCCVCAMCLVRGCVCAGTRAGTWTYRTTEPRMKQFLTDICPRPPQRSQRRSPTAGTAAMRAHLFVTTLLVNVLDDGPGPRSTAGNMPGSAALSAPPHRGHLH